MSINKLVEEEVASYDDITVPFDPSKIEITMKSITVDLLTKRLAADEIAMETAFQRKSGLWGSTEKSQLIESLLVRIPLPAFYFDGSDDNEWLVVDGLQRLTAIRDFIVKQDFTLSNLEFLKQYEGYVFSDLPRSLQRRIEETQVTIFVINPGTPPGVKYNIFKRINTGGLTLERQEIRHALNQGKASEFLEKLSDLEVFKNATSYSIKEDRMLDREFVLRFIAFNLTHYKDYIPELDTFLNDAMQKLNELSKNNLLVLEQRFINSMRNAIAIFGDDAFRKRYNPNDKKNPINKALFETWSVVLGVLEKSQAEKLIKHKDYLIDLFSTELNTNTQFEKSITSSTSKKTMVITRFSAIEGIVKEVISID